MAHHLSAKKRIRQSELRRLHNRYYARSARNAVKQLRSTKEKEAAAALSNAINILNMALDADIFNKAD